MNANDEPREGILVIEGGRLAFMVSKMSFACFRNAVMRPILDFALA